MNFAKYLGNENRIRPKVLINIGACFDIPTGALITGKKGETLINGGLSPTTAIIGAGNNYKSTILNYFGLAACDRIIEGCGHSAMTTYDTEVNTSLDRLETLSNRFQHIPENPITGPDSIWSVMDKSTITADKWTDSIFKYMEDKAKDSKMVIELECFKDPYSDTPLKIPVPTFGVIDSLTEFEASSTMNLLTDNLDSSDTNTYAMKQGAFKTKFISQLPRLCNSSNTYLLLTAHLGEKIDMATGPAKYNQPTKKLQYLKSADNIKGVSGKFTFLLTGAWAANTASKLNNPTTKLAEYPLDNTIDSVETELNTVRLTQLRSKFGPSGINVVTVVSQDEGVLPTLTEFHNIKENKPKNSPGFGMGGNDRTYFLEIYPDVNLSRTTIRVKIDSDPMLRRAINITSEIQQLGLYHKPSLDADNLNCTMKELYDDIKALGFDWDMILKTREYWTINQYTNPIPYLSSVDLLKMRKGLYFPYFLNPEDKTIKKEYKQFIELCSKG